jgi:predicted NUDIX family phosphoesterase
MNERVLAVPRPAIERHLRQGFLDSDSAELMEALSESSVFLDRPQAEEDPSHKQVIPYIVVTHKRRFLVYRRTKKQGESRLHDKFSLGFGGHINDIDGSRATGTNVILAAMVRELNEEVFIPAPRQLSVVGFINDDSNAVGKVHLGVAFIVETGNERFEVNEPDKIEAKWRDAAEIEGIYPQLETWSQLLWSQFIRPKMIGSQEPPARAVA